MMDSNMFWLSFKMRNATFCDCMQQHTRENLEDALSGLHLVRSLYPYSTHGHLVADGQIMAVLRLTILVTEDTSCALSIITIISNAQQ
jgi:hypothetical protein